MCVWEWGSLACSHTHFQSLSVLYVCLCVCLCCVGVTTLRLLFACAFTSPPPPPLPLSLSLSLPLSPPPPPPPPPSLSLSLPLSLSLSLPLSPLPPSLSLGYDIPETVLLQVYCEGRVLAQSEFTFYANNQYHSDQLFQYLVQNMPQYFQMDDIPGINTNIVHNIIYVHVLTLQCIT